MKTFREILEARGLTPTLAAKASGIPLITIATHYYGTRQMSIESVLRYEKELGIPKEELRPDLWPSKEKE